MCLNTVHFYDLYIYNHLIVIQAKPLMLVNSIGSTEYINETEVAILKKCSLEEYHPEECQKN